MIFVYKKWDKFCKALFNNNMISIPAKEVKKGMNSFIVLKHDIETNVQKAYKLAKIESKYGHRGTYYAHAYLFEKEKNVKILSKIQKMGHEVSYHYDVMDSNKGNIEKAINEFDNNVKVIRKKGFEIKTVCQHGNPIVERMGYNSNRDFFRNKKVEKKYEDIVDIMVNFKEKYKVDYKYYSDAGRKFKLIFDPITCDILKNDDKNIPYENLEELFNNLENKTIISTHPHRWTRFTIEYILKSGFATIIKHTAKILAKNPFIKKIMSRFYFLAKKI